MYPGVGGALLMPLFSWQCVCAREKGGGRIEGLVPIILRAMPVHWVSLRLCTAYSAVAGLICYPNTGSCSLKLGSSGQPQICFLALF